MGSAVSYKLTSTPVKLSGFAVWSFGDQRGVSRGCGRQLGCGSADRPSLAETVWTPAIKNPVDQMVGYVVMLGNRLMTVFALPYKAVDVG